MRPFINVAACHLTPLLDSLPSLVPTLHSWLQPPPLLFRGSSCPQVTLIARNLSLCLSLSH